MSETSTTTCWIYRSPKQAEMYLYLGEKDAFDRLPEAFFARFGSPELVMELELHPARKLARADAGRVLEGLAEKGFYLQMPPEIQAELYEAEA